MFERGHRNMASRVNPQQLNLKFKKDFSQGPPNFPLWETEVARRAASLRQFEHFVLLHTTLLLLRAHMR